MDVIKFKKIKLENVRSHLNFEMDFEDNTLIEIVGKNGSGKSTIFMALNMGLYGESGEKNIKITDMVNKKKNKNLKIEIDFCCVTPEKSIDYKILKYYKHSKFGNKTILLEDGKDISGTTVAETHVKIENLVLPKQIFKNTIYFAQQVKDFFTSLTDSDQKKIFESILGLEEWKLRYDKTDQELKNQQKKLEESSHNMEYISATRKEKNQLLRHIEEDLEKQKIQNKEKLEELNRQVKSINLQITKKRNEAEQLDYKETEHHNLLDKQKDLNSQIKELHKEFEREKKLIEDNSKTEIDKLNIQCDSEQQKIKFQVNEKLKETRDKVHEKTQQISEEIYNLRNDEVLKTLQRELQEKKDSFQKEYDSYRHTQDQLESKKESLLHEKISYENDLQELEENLKEINEQASPKCPTCNQDMEKKAKDSALKNLTQKKDLLDKKINDVVIQIEKTTKEIKNIVVKKDQYNKKEAREIDEHSIKIEKLEFEIDEKIKNLEKEKRDLIDKDKDVQDKASKKIKDFCEKIVKDFQMKINEQIKKVGVSVEKLNHDLQCNKDHLLEKVAEIDEKVEGLEGKKKIYEEIKEILNKLITELEYKAKEIHNHEKWTSDTTKLEEVKKDLNALDERIEIIKNDISFLKKDVKILSFWKEGFSDRGIKSILIDETIPYLNKKVQDELTKISPGKFIVSFDTLSETKSGDIRDRFSVNVLNTETGADKHNLLSGGEKRIIDVCIMSALRSLTENLYNKKINLTLLDEVLDSLDSENCSTFCKTLRVLSKNKCILLITHSRDLSTEYDVIYNL